MLWIMSGTFKQTMSLMASSKMYLYTFCSCLDKGDKNDSGLLKKNYTDKYFHTNTVIMMQSNHGCIYHNNISDYPHHVIIKHYAECQMCQWDCKASTVTSYTRFSNGYDVTMLALLSHWHVQHMAQCSIIA